MINSFLAAANASVGALALNTQLVFIHLNYG
jgi:hypothetical protein